MFFTTIVIENLKPGTTSKQVAQATGYHVACVEMNASSAQPWSAWIETDNDGQEAKKTSDAIQGCYAAGLAVTS